jgi:hypothetical protein
LPGLGGEENGDLGLQTPGSFMALRMRLPRSHVAQRSAVATWFPSDSLHVSGYLAARLDRRHVTASNFGPFKKQKNLSKQICSGEAFSVF